MHIAFTYNIVKCRTQDSQANSNQFLVETLNSQTYKC